MIKLVFLGTSAGIPTRERNVTSLAIQLPQSKRWSLVDCGEGTQRQLYSSPCSIGRIDHIFITHLHGDHVFGLPGLLSSRTLLDLEHPLTLVGPTGLHHYVEHSLRATYSRGIESLTIIEFPLLSGGTYDLSSFQVRAIPLRHSVPSFAYLWQEKTAKRPFLIQKAQQESIPPGPDYQKLQRGEHVTLADGRKFSGQDFLGPELPCFKFIIGGDNAEPAILEPFLQNCQLLVHEATYGEHDFGKLSRPQLHSTAKKLAQTAQAAGLPHLIMTHFSPRYKDAESLDELHKEACRHFEGNVELACDFAEFELNRRRELRRHEASW